MKNTIKTPAERKPRIEDGTQLNNSMYVMFIAAQKIILKFTFTNYICNMFKGVMKRIEYMNQTWVGIKRGMILVCFHSKLGYF